MAIFETPPIGKVEWVIQKSRQAAEAKQWEDAETALCKATKRQSCRYCPDASCSASPYRREVFIGKGAIVTNCGIGSSE